MHPALDLTICTYLTKLRRNKEQEERKETIKVKGEERMQDRDVEEGSSN